jgi:hypothetical protein
MQDFLIAFDRGQYDFQLWMIIAVILIFITVFYAKGESK